MITTVTDRKILDFYLYLRYSFDKLELQRARGIALTNEQCYAELYSKIFKKSGSILENNDKLKLLNIFSEAYYKEKLKPSNLLSATHLTLSYIPDSGRVLTYSDSKFFDGLALKNGENGDLGKIALIATLSLFTGFTFLAFYYIVSRSLNSAERFIYDENWLKASLTIASILAGAAAGACLGFYIVGPAIMYCGFIVLGMTNPFGLAIGGVVVTSILLAALTCLVTNAIQNIAFEKFNVDALDPKDAARFEISESQEQALIEIGFDVDVVRCAIVALRNEMPIERVPSLFSRWICSTPRMEKIKHNLELIRQLKNGSYDLEKPLDLPELNLTFNVKSENHSNSYSISEDDLDIRSF